jgi:hypothetical protein
MPSGGQEQIVINAEPRPVAGFMLTRRLAEAHDYFLAPDPPALTLRALETWEPGVLWGLLLHLNYIPEPADKQVRHGELFAERAKLKGRVREAMRDGREGLARLATEFYEGARARLVTVPRERRGGTKKESAARRRRVLRALVAGMPGWKLIEIARLVLEAPRAWQHPPCAELAAEYALADDDEGCAAWLADLFRQDLKR